MELRLQRWVGVPAGGPMVPTIRERLLVPDFSDGSVVSRLDVAWVWSQVCQAVLARGWARGEDRRSWNGLRRRRPDLPWFWSQVAQAALEQQLQTLEDLQ